MKKHSINNLIIVSDTHCGCRLGLCPPEPVGLDDGGSYHYSKMQAKMWKMWQYFWDIWVPEVSKGEPYAVLVNGDMIDGVHHQSTTQISQNILDQAEIARRIFEPIVERCEGRFYMVRGTEAHVGKSATDEERIARMLGAVPNDENQYARWLLRLRVGDALVHCLHHIGTTSSSAHEGSAVNAEISSVYVQCARWGWEVPDYVVRSHRHHSIVVDLDTAKGYGASIVTPGWQAHTPLCYRMAGARNTEPQFGGFLIRQGDEEHFYRRKIWPLDPPKIEVPVPA
jgi:hypothetical protein